MFLDALLKFSAAQAITAAAASTSAVDLSEARNIGEGRDIYVLTCVDVTMTDGGGNTGLQVSLYGDSSTSFTPDGQQLMFTIPAVSTAGSGPYYGKISPDFLTTAALANYRYLELYYTPTGANLTAGSFTSYLVTDIAGFVAYAKNYTIS